MSFVGQTAEVPFGAEGLTGSKNQASVRPSQLLKGDNLTYEDDTLRKEGGAAKYNATAISGSPSILAGWDWHPDVSTQRMIILTGAGALLKDNGGGTFTVTLKTGLNVTEKSAVFVEGGKEAAAQNRKLFIFTGKNAVQVLSGDGATTSDISSPPADWAGTNHPKFGFHHDNRLFGGGNENDPHRLYYSPATDHEDIAGGGTLSIYPGEGEGLLAGVSFKGLIVLFKRPHGIYLVDTTDPNLANWRVNRISKGIGIKGRKAWAMIDNDILFQQHNGHIQLVSTVDEFGNLGTQSLTQSLELLPYIRENFNITGDYESEAIYYTDKREVHFAMASKGSTVKDRRLVFDLNKQDLPRPRVSDRDAVTSLFLREGNLEETKIMAGTEDGFIYELDQDDRSKDGTGYLGQFQTAHLDFSFLDPKLGTVRKNGAFLELVVEPKGNWNLNVDVMWDGGIVDTITFNMGLSGAGLDDFTLDTDVLAGDQVLNRRRKLIGSGRRLSLIGRNNGTSQDFSVARFYVHFTVGDESDES